MSLTAVALSGGIDSLASLLLLQESGAEVMAVHARFAPQDDPALHERLHALCARLGIAWHLLDLRAEFEHLVIAPFLAAFQKGQTPNPCALCNPAMKFGLMLEHVLALGATTLATGHYCALEHAADGPRLRKGLDADKDQSYFLSLVPRDRLRHVCFPLANTTKTQAVQILKRHGLRAPVPEESQEICFIPEDYRIFLRERQVILSAPGPIALRDGTVLGRHAGLWNYTLGQRKGLGVAFTEPLYVLAKDHRSNELIVGPKSQTLAQTVQTGAPNFLRTPQDWPTQVLVQTIYRQRPAPAQVRWTQQSMSIMFDQPRPLATPGQVAAVYAPDGEVLAGAVIISEPCETTHAV